MSGCLVPPLSVYSSPLVIYSSSLGIYSCCLLDAFIKGILKCFIHMTNYFLSIFQHLATIISQGLSLLFLNMFFQPINFVMQMVDYMFDTQPFLFIWVLSKYFVKSFIASCCSSTFNLSSFFTLLAFSLSYFGLPFFQCLSPYFHNFHLLLYYLFSQQQSIHCFLNIIFRCIHQRLIHMLHRCNCLFSFYCLSK